MVCERGGRPSGAWRKRPGIKMSLADQSCESGLTALQSGDLQKAEEHFQDALSKKFVRDLLFAHSQRQLTSAGPSLPQNLSHVLNCAPLPGQDHAKTRYYYGLMLQNQRKNPAGAEACWRAVSMFQIKNRFHVQLLCNLAVA